MNEEIRNKDLEKLKQSKEPKEQSKEQSKEQPKGYKKLKPGDWCESGLVVGMWEHEHTTEYKILPLGRIDLKDEDIVRPPKKNKKESHNKSGQEEKERPDKDQKKDKKRCFGCF